MKAKARPNRRTKTIKIIKVLLMKCYAIATFKIWNKDQKYQNETSYTLQGGQNYKETVFF